MSKTVHKHSQKEGKWTGKWFGKITQSHKKIKNMNTKLKHKEDKLRKSNLLLIGVSERLINRWVGTKIMTLQILDS